MRNGPKLGVLFLCLFLAFMQTALLAGTTGKISGRVLDSETGEPLPGVNVIIENTSMGAATGVEGEYAIINIPPGFYNLRFSMMGYTTQIVQDVRVQIDLTTKINSKLSPTVLQAGEEVTVVAERPIVQRDMTGSMSTVSSREMEVTPAQSVGGVLELQAGIVNAGGLHIRGGRSGEVAYWVDGVATTDVYSYGNTAAIENSAVQELQVISGTFNAEYGQAMSGIINIITKDGGTDYHGQIKGYVGDYLSADDEYSVLDRVEAVEGPVTGETRVNEVKKDPLKLFNPSYNGEFSLSGPVPFTNDKLSFFTNARYFTNEGYLYGREWFLPSGVPGDSALVPMNPHERLTGLLKLTYALSPSIKLRYSVNLSEWQNDRSFNRSYRYVPGGVPMSKGNSQTHLFSVNHVLSSKTFYELKVSRMRNEYENYVHKDTNFTPDWLVRVPADSVNPSYTFDPTSTDGDSLLAYLQQYGIQYDWVADPTQPEGYVHQDSARTPIAYSYLRSGNSLGQTFRSSAYWIGKFDMTSQVNKVHQVKGGFELRLHELDLDTYTLQGKTVGGQEATPFVPVIPEQSSIKRSIYNRQPIEFSAYLQDKLELTDLIMNIGLRFDYFDANSVVPTDPMDPNIYAPFKDENVYRNPSAPEDELEEYSPAERRDFMHKKVDPKMQLSPRLGIAYPITDRGVIHFSYGHFFQIPEFQYLYAAPDFKLNTGGGYTIFGNADLEPQRTVQYEIGLQQELRPGLGIDVALFYRDIRDWVGTSPLQPTLRDVVKYSTYENKDYANVRGITLKAEQRFMNNFSAKLDYSYQVAEGTYSNPNDAFNAYVNENEPRRNMIPLNWDQRHTLNAQFIYSINDWTASLVGKYRTGLPYTPSFAKYERVGGTALASLPENSSRRPIIASVDLYLTKRIPLGNGELTAFAYVYNLLDNRAATNVWSDTGSPTYTTDPDPAAVPYSPLRVGTVEDLYNRPEWFIAPRQVQVGLSYGF